MENRTPKRGRPGEISQWPRWEGPEETRPSGYLPGEANIFADRPEEQKHRGKGPANYKRADPRIEEDVNEALTQEAFVDATDISVSVRDGIVELNGTVENRNAKRRAEDCACSVTGVKDCQNNLRLAPTPAV